MIWIPSFPCSSILKIGEKRHVLGGDVQISIGERCAFGSHLIFAIQPDRSVSVIAVLVLVFVVLVLCAISFIIQTSRRPILLRT
jgi:hypothetical protein